MTKLRQHVMHCRCGKAKVLAHGMCAVCYTLKRQDEEHFGGLREKVLERDGYRCRVCDASGRDKRSIIVHHRVPREVSSRSHDLALSLPAMRRSIGRASWCGSCLLFCWSYGEEQHPQAHEQTALNFSPVRPPAKGRGSIRCKVNVALVAT